MSRHETAYPHTGGGDARRETGPRRETRDRESRSGAHTPHDTLDLMEISFDFQFPKSPEAYIRTNKSDSTPPLIPISISVSISPPTTP